MRDMLLQQRAAEWWALWWSGVQGKHIVWSKGRGQRSKLQDSWKRSWRLRCTILQDYSVADKESAEQELSDKPTFKEGHEGFKISIIVVEGRLWTWSTCSKAVSMMVSKGSNLPNLRRLPLWQIIRKSSSSSSDGLEVVRSIHHWRSHCHSLAAILHWWESQLSRAEPFWLTDNVKKIDRYCSFQHIKRSVIVQITQPRTINSQSMGSASI